MSSIVYCAVNAINGDKYIGMTTKNLEERMKSHKYHAFSKKKLGAFQNAIRKYGWGNFNFYVLSKWGSCEAALREEMRVISLVNPKYNMTGGGETLAGYKMPEELKPYKKIVCLNDGKVFESIKAAAKFYGVLRHRISTILKEKEISAKGFFFSYYSDSLLDEKNRKALLEKKKTLKKFSKFNSSSVVSKPVICINDGHIYCSALEAARHYNISDGSIRNSCNGKTKSIIGLHFKYLENESDDIQREKYIPAGNNNRKIICIEDDIVFSSIIEAAKFYGASDGNIGSVLRGKRAHTKGKTFKYLESK